MSKNKLGSLENTSSTKCSLKDNHKDEDLFSDLENLTHQSHDAICEQEDPCDVPFTIEELDLALSELSNSATGSDCPNVEGPT